MRSHPDGTRRRTGRPRTTARSALLALCLFLAAAPQAAADGEVDLSFGSGAGIAFLPLPPLVSGTTRAVRVRVRPDGRIVVLAQFVPTGEVTPQADFLYQLLPSGARDISFGIDGIAVLVPGGQNSGEHWATALERAPDGALIVGETNKDLIGQSFLGVGRRFANGTADPGFGFGFGWRFAVIGAEVTRLVDLDVYPDGSVLAFANSRESSDLTQFGFQRFLPDGNDDASFGVGGVSVADFSGPFDTSTVVYGSQMRIDPTDGSIVFVGSVHSVVAGIPGDQWLMGRLTSSGFFDPGFNGSGKLFGSFAPIDPLASDKRLVSVLPLADGTYLGVGDFVASSGPSRGVLVKILGDGTIDENWGLSGHSWFLFHAASTSNFVDSCVLDRVERAVCGGSSFVGGQGWAAVARFEGPLFDPRFGIGGSKLFAWGLIDDQVADVAIDPNGHIVVAFTWYDAAGEHAAVTRLRGGLPFTDDFESGGTYAWSARVP